jgi:hypothetical protein
LTKRQTEILQWFDGLDADNPPDDPSNKAVELMEEYASSDQLLGDLVERYAASPALHLVNCITFCIRRRIFSLDPALGRSLALRIIHLHTCQLNPETCNMIADLLALGTEHCMAPWNIDALTDIKRLVLICLEWCPGSNPPLHFWPTIDLLDGLCEEGLLDRVLDPGDQVYAFDQLGMAFEHHGSSLDKDDLEKYFRVVSALTAPRT